VRARAGNDANADRSVLCRVRPATCGRFHSSLKCAAGYVTDVVVLGLKAAMQLRGAQQAAFTLARGGVVRAARIAPWPPGCACDWGFVWSEVKVRRRR